MSLLLPLFAIAAAALPAPQASSGTTTQTSTCPPSASPTSVAADLSGSTDSIFLPWKGGFANDKTPHVAMNIEGVGDISMSTDSGSTGIILSSVDISNYSQLSQGLPTVPHYLSSSSLLYTGKLVPLKVTFPGQSLADGSAVNATGTIPILGVENLVKCPWYDASTKGTTCPPRPAGDTRTMTNESATGIQYMGVGFGHEDSDPKAFSMPSTNAFLNINSIVPATAPATQKRQVGTSIRTGWLLSAKGVVLGLTTDNTQNMGWEQLPAGALQATTEPRDWLTAPAGVSLDQTSLPGGVSTCTIPGQNGNCFVQGTALVDTGLQNSFIKLPQANFAVANARTADNKTAILPNGSVVTASFNSACNSSFAGSYTFKVGAGMSVEPSQTEPLAFNQTLGAFINTGRDFLNGHDIAYDAVAGRFGLRTVGAADGLDKVKPEAAS